MCCTKELYEKTGFFSHASSYLGLQRQHHQSKLERRAVEFSFGQFENCRLRLHLSRSLQRFGFFQAGFFGQSENSRLRLHLPGTL